MKTIILSGLCILSLAFTSCKKTFMDTNSANISQSFSNGYLYNTWVINDEDSQKNAATVNSATFSNKANPTFTFKSDGRYEFSFVDNGTQSLVTETGMYTIDLPNKQLSLKGGPKSSGPTGNWPNYTFQVQQLSEEVLQLGNTVTNTTKTVDTRGQVDVQTRTTTDTLYMEDND